MAIVRAALAGSQVLALAACNDETWLLLPDDCFNRFVDKLVASTRAGNARRLPASESVGGAAEG
jgi:hypothetical protein